MTTYHLIEISTLAMKHASIRSRLTLVTMEDLELHQLDVKTTFFHGELEEEFYMKQAKGFKRVCKKDHVCHLEKSLHGLKQSPKTVV